MRRAIGVGAILAALLVLGPPAWAGAPAEGKGPPHEMEVMGVAADPRSGAPVVFLRSKQDRRELTMFIGPAEAQAIALVLEGMRLPRPYTHDLALEAIHRLDGKVSRVVITEMRENTYFAVLVLERQGKEITLDARPSDAIAFALREHAPILATDAVLAAARAPGEKEPETPGVEPPRPGEGPTKL
jgi:bifunctional DNase/RNase